MIVNRGYKYRLYPTREQQKYLNQVFGACRFIWNQMLEDRIKAYEAKGESLKTRYASYVEDFPWLKEVDSQALNYVQRDLDQAYKNFFRRLKKGETPGFPKFKKRGRCRDSYKTRRNSRGNGLKIEDGRLKVPKLDSTIKMKIHRPFPEGAKICDAVISKTHTNEYYVSFCIEFEMKKKKGKSKTIGLDFSTRDYFVDSRGNIPDYPHYYKKEKERLAREQRKLSRCEFGSNNYEKQRIKVAKIHQKIARKRTYFAHCLSRKLAEENKVVAVEGLKLQEMQKSNKDKIDEGFRRKTLKNFNSAISDIAYYAFCQMLEYKSDEYTGHKYIKIDTYFPSSKTCYKCGHVIEKNDLDEKTFICPVCGYKEHRDINAAKNILKEGKRLVN